jgi:hypothetical protein
VGLAWTLPVSGLPDLSILSSLIRTNVYRVDQLKAQATL